MKREIIIRFAFFCLLLYSASVQAQLSGTYLIGPTAPVYKTINQAVQDLYLSHGVKGPVTFNIQDGVYDEQIYIPQINNSSVTNLVTFQSLSGDSSKVIIKFKPGNDTFNYTLMLDGANFLVFRKLTFTTDTVFGRVIDINNQCSFNQFINNRIIGMQGSKELVYSESTPTSYDNYNRFDNNIFQFGSVGICFYGVDNTTMEEGNEILRNKFVDQSQQAIDLKYSYAFKIRSNTIVGKAGTADYTGIKIQSCRDKFYIEKNKLDIDNKTFSGHGIAVLFCIGTNPTTSSSISNNFIHIYSNTYVYVGGIENFSTYKNYYFNSINLSGDNEAAIGFNNISGGFINVINNIFSVPARGLSLVLNDTTDVTCNFNNLFTSGSTLASDGANFYDSLGSWINATKRDINSISTNPMFFSNTDLHTRNFRLTKKGKSISGINEDIDGNSRKSPNPDIGADEFIYKLDLGPDRLVCAGNSVTIYAEKGFDTYAWSDGSNADSIAIDSAGVGIGSRKLKLTVTYGSHTYSDSIIISFIKVMANISPQKTFCEGESVTVMGSGGTKFLWNTGDTTSKINIIAVNSLYLSVLVTDNNGCYDSAFTWIKVRPRPAKPEILIVGTDSLMSSVKGSTFRWYLYGIQLPNDTRTIKANSSGNYQVVVYDSSCKSDTSDIYHFHLSFIPTPTSDGGLILYPNPVSSNLIIEVGDFDHKGAVLEIISHSGKTIYKSTTVQNTLSLQVSDYPKGIYIVKLSGNGKLHLARFVIQ